MTRLCELADGCVTVDLDEHDMLTITNVGPVTVEYAIGFGHAPWRIAPGHWVYSARGLADVIVRVSVPPVRLTVPDPAAP